MEASRESSKYWCFTQFKDEPKYDPEKDEYLIYGREICPTTGREHFQAYVIFKERQYFSYIKERFPTAHIERARGTPEKNKTYCSKDGNITEFGQFPKALSENERFRDVIKLAEQGDMASIKDTYPGLYKRYKKTLETLRKFNTSHLSEPCGLWLSGPPGSCKDYVLKKKFSSLYVKDVSKWWDGYNDEEAVLINDIKPCHKKFMGRYLKLWADNYPFRAEIRHSSIEIRPEYICVTSNFAIDEIFEGIMLEGLLYRFDQLKLAEGGDVIDYIPKKKSVFSDRFLKNLNEIVGNGLSEKETAVEAVVSTPGLQVNQKKKVKRNKVQPKAEKKILQGSTARRVTVCTGNSYDSSDEFQ